METVKMPSVIRTKAAVVSEGQKPVSRAEKSGDFAKLLQEKGQAAETGESQAKAAPADSGKAAKADARESQTADGKPKDPKVEDILAQAGIQQAAAQITGLLPEELQGVSEEESGSLTEVWDSGVVEILPKVQESREEGLLTEEPEFQEIQLPTGEKDLGIVKILPKVQGSEEGELSAEESQDPVAHVAAKTSEGPEAAREPLTLRTRLTTDEPEAAKRPAGTESPADQNSASEGEEKAPESGIKTGEPPVLSDPSKAEGEASKLPESPQESESLKGTGMPEDSAGNQGKELAAGPVLKDDSQDNGRVERDENGLRILRGISDTDRKPEAARPNISGTAAISRREDTKAGQEGKVHLTYRTDSLQEQPGEMYEVFKTEPVRIKTSYSQLPQDLGKTLAARLPGSGREMVIELEPASLGKLTIKLAYEAGRAAVSILASNPRTLELLNQKASEIAAILEEKTGEETIIYTHAPEQKEQEPDQSQNNQGRQQQEEGSKKDRQDQQQTESFAQQLRLGLI